MLGFIVMPQRSCQGFVGILTIVTIYTIVRLQYARNTTKSIRINPPYKQASADFDALEQNRLLQRQYGFMLENNKNSGTCDQKTRLHRLQEACPKVTQKLERSQITKLKGRLLVYEKSKIILCSIPKTGSSTWKKLLVNITGYNVSNKFPIHGDNIRKFGMKFLSQYNKSEASNILNDPRYMRFLAVRHPIDRLISAYRDKFVKVYTYAEGYSKMIAKHYHPERNTSSNATLQEFLQFLSEHYTRIQNDHWRKYTELCQPCVIKYHMVLKLETIDDDTEALYNKISEMRPDIKLRSVRSPPVLNPTNRSISHPFRILKELEGLPDKVISDLYREYKHDFELFGYTFDKKGLIALCEDANKRCC